MLNPKIENKKAKDAYYAFRDCFSDIVVAQLGESLSTYLKVPNLLTDVTPLYIKLESDPLTQMKLLRNLMRNFIKHTHTEYRECGDAAPDKSVLPLFYPHEKFVRKSKQQIIPIQDLTEPSIPSLAEKQKIQSEKQTEVDAKNEYFLALFSILGSFQLLLDSIKQGNGLNCFLIQKKVLKIVQGTGH